MCGISGYICPRRNDKRFPHVLRAMADALAHRGPDDAGIWHDEEAGVGLAHRRLSIIDLSAAGAQPMTSASGRFVLVYNGEVFNHLDIRRDLDAGGYDGGWRGHSDTETLLAAIEAWGLERALKASVGMFALALWCRQARTLFLARDRMGEKPLYYGWIGSGANEKLVFGSELKALRTHPDFDAAIDRTAISQFMRYAYVPAPLSIYEGIRKVMPGHIVAFASGERQGVETPYWSLSETVEAAKKNPFDLHEPTLIEGLETILTKSVRGQMESDVPLGAFLSGGVDSSVVAALMQKVSNKPIKTFTIGFSESGFDEAPFARAVAQHLGSDHTELYLTGGDALEVIPRLPSIYDEPFADSSQIPTFLVSQLAQSQVTVALSGDGGDELFAGYTRYSATSSLWRTISRLPLPARQLAAGLIRAVPTTAYRQIGSLAGGVLPKALRGSNFGDKMKKGADVLTSADEVDLYCRLISCWKSPNDIVVGGGEQSLPACAPASLTGVERMMLEDMLGYLPGDILTKVDRAAMAASLETRVPLLDHRVVDFAWRVPHEAKWRDGQGKWLLRQVLYRHVPKDLIERPKAGFAIPVQEWLQGPLRDWVEDLLDAKALEEQGYLRAGPIRQKWAQHLSGERNWSGQLWAVLMFQAWLAGRHS